MDYLNSSASVALIPNVMPAVAVLRPRAFSYEVPVSAWRRPELRTASVLVMGEGSAIAAAPGLAGVSAAAVAHAKADHTFDAKQAGPPRGSTG
jgi:hypothetical protein